MNYYQSLFDHMYQEHNLILLESEMQDIVHLVEQMNCPHLSTNLQTIATAVNCETTVVCCDHCGKHLTKPKTDCN